MLRFARATWRLCLIGLTTIGTLCHAGVAHAREALRPNIVLVLLDNVGWGELGVYGGGSLRGAPTPQIDAFAASGLRLTNFNVEASCTPTRSALMTGRYSVRSGTLQSGATGLVKWEVTLPQLLKQQGYATAHFGKWHLGDEPGRYPSDFGFDTWWGIPRTSHEAMWETSPGYDPSVTPPMYIMQGNAGSPSTKVKPYDMQARADMDGELVDRAIGWVKGRAGSKSPFFAYIPLTQVHFPATPSAAFRGKSGYGDFADSMMQTDYLVGKLIKAIDAMGLAGNTLVIVASDNGPEYRRPWRGTAGPWTGTMHTIFEGGLRAPAMMRWPGHIKPGGVSDGVVHVADLFTTLAHVGGAETPTDRPIDGVDQIALLTGATAKSARDGFPAYMGGGLYGAKFRDWKYHILWKPDPEKPMEKLPFPRLFNLTTDPKEESPRGVPGVQVRLEDLWVFQPIQRMIRDMEASLKEYPPIPLGAPLDYVPKRGAPVPREAVRGE